MLRVDGAYLYDLGATLRSIKMLADKDTDRITVMISLFVARDKLKEFVYGSIFKSGMRTLVTSAGSFLRTLEEMVPEFKQDIDYSEKVHAWQITHLKEAFAKFEAVLVANLQTADLYLVSPKGGFETQALTDGGLQLFPPDLLSKIPECSSDVAAATKCIAFELPTAAAFHLMRVTEAVLRRYFDERVGADKRPQSGNMGEFLNVMRTQELGDKRVLESLKALKDLHRNPLMHPDAILESIEDAISLYAAVRAAVGYMLTDMTGEQIGVTAPLPLEEPPQPRSIAIPASKSRRPSQHPREILDDKL